ncbi:hypothetical protein N782_11790 [Pontibacillus yanchengensis Y32]|uniref:Uncharacterized protein n=2 Tax=Pontibacillus yanchengensis TaxID=462910 RepID=A0A0A2TAG1_9BACI|nr:hypothetical protein N782_11790 [Pontibacillus yanchengensis Y32]
MYLIVIVCFWLLIAFFLLDMHHFTLYYSTIQYYIILNLVYNLLYYNHTLWAFQGISTKLLNHTIIDLTFSFIVLPIAICIYLKYFPFIFPFNFLYIAIWSSFFTFLEWACFQFGMFVYDNGWAILHTLWFNALLFSMLRLHSKKPFMALSLSIPITIILIFFFPIPFAKLK